GARVPAPALSPAVARAGRDRHRCRAARAARADLDAGDRRGRLARRGRGAGRRPRLPLRWSARAHAAGPRRCDGPRGAWGAADPDRSDLRAASVDAALRAARAVRGRHRLRPGPAAPDPAAVADLVVAPFGADPDAFPAGQGQAAPSRPGPDIRQAWPDRLQ